MINGNEIIYNVSQKHIVQSRQVDLYFIKNKKEKNGNKNRKRIAPLFHHDDDDKVAEERSIIEKKRIENCD